MGIWSAAVASNMESPSAVLDRRFSYFIVLLPNLSLRTIRGLFRALDKPAATPISSCTAHELLAVHSGGWPAFWMADRDRRCPANTVRNQALIQTAGQQIQASIKANPVFQGNPALALNTAVFSGLFLDINRDFALIVGYSWIDGHAQQFASTAVGWTPAPPLLDPRRITLMKLADEMQAICALTELAKWEGNIRGKWPAVEYNRLLAILWMSLLCIYFPQFRGALGHLGNEGRAMFVHSSKALNLNFISDVMAAFALVSQSLANLCATSSRTACSAACFITMDTPARSPRPPTINSPTCRR
ncbi:hypothetical protein B0H19DRAFT_1272709 [Mycena capillaripes]|nr:hypothetical protein B0H19DRAFT_1272709 [Mycena capillaripes]